MKSIVWCAILLLLSGCSEYVRFRSAPPGARVFVDGREIGVTPVDFSTRSVIARAYRVDMAACGPIEGRLTPRFGPGRVVGSIFTVGILTLIKPIKYYVEDPVSAACPVVRFNRAKLYNLKQGTTADGLCNERGECMVKFPDGIVCETDVPTTDAGAAVFRCGEFLVDCTVRIEATSWRGQGDCEGTDGTKYRLVLLPN